MDLIFLTRYLLLVVTVMSLAGEVESRKVSPKWVKRSMKKEKIRHHHGGFVGRQSSESFENPKAYKIKCCKNGGRCIMGSFCQCKKDYFGRYCEYKTENKPCGVYKHGIWLKSGCNLCRCFDGVLSCIPRAYSGCDDKPADVRDKFNPNDEVYIFPVRTTQQPDDAHSDYDVHDGNVNDDDVEPSSASLISGISWLLFLPFVVFNWRVFCY